ncbi:tail fiber protein [Peptostreptococcaceae bacterium AGR-M142]
MDQVYIGDIQLFPFYFTPRNWAECSGQLMEIQSNPTLYSLLGNKFGGNGNTTFALPNLEDASPISGMHYCISMQGTYPPRD